MDMAVIIQGTLRYLAGKGTEAFVSKLIEKTTLGAMDAIYRWFSSNARNAAVLEGLWEAQVSQRSGSRKGPSKLLVRLTRKKGSSLLVGRGLLWPAKHPDPPMSSETDIIDFTATKTGNFLRLDFRNADQDKVQFGTIIGHVTSGKHDTIEGQYSAISIADQKLVSGGIKMNKYSTPTAFSFLSKLE